MCLWKKESKSWLKNEFEKKKKNVKASIDWYLYTQRNQESLQGPVTKNPLPSAIWQVLHGRNLLAQRDPHMNRSRAD